MNEFNIVFQLDNGEWDNISLDAMKEYTPAFSDQVLRQKYDKTVQDLITESDRKTIQNIYVCKTGYKTTDERMRLIQLLKSTSVFVEANSFRFGCNVSSDSQTFAVSDGIPIQITLKIELQDKDGFFSPMLFDYIFDPVPDTYFVIIEGKKIRIDNAYLIL